MILSFKTDRLYEEAARDRDSCDKLLLLLRRARRNSFLCSLGFAIILVAVCGVGLFFTNQFLRSPVTAAMPPALTWLLANEPLIWMCAAPVISTVVIEFVRMLNFDSNIKILLFLRSQTDRAAKQDDSRNAS